MPDLVTERATTHQLELTAALTVSAMVGVAVWLTAPYLLQFPGSVIPWPAHGLAIAALLACRPRNRVLVSVMLGLAVFLAGAISSGAPGRAFTATTLLVGQTVAVCLLNDRLGRGGSWLGATNTYAALLVSILAGCAPLAVIAELVIAASGSPISPGFTAMDWWIAAATSGVALVPAVLGAFIANDRDEGSRSIRSWEFAVLLGMFIPALLDAFLSIGPLGGIVPPIIATLPFLTWAGLRFGVRGYSIVALSLVATVLGSTAASIGPFQAFAPDALHATRRGWFYVASIIGPAMVLPIALAERARAQQRTRAAHAQLTALVESTPDLIAGVDRDLVILALNQSWINEWERLTGAIPRAGMSMADVLEALPFDRDASLARWRRALKGERFVYIGEFGDPARFREEYEVTYGPVRDPKGEIVGAAQMIRNVTEQRRKELEDQEARRLESIGRLAGGVAHDFNNLMTAVMGYAELVARSLPADDPRRSDLAEVERAAARAGELTQQLLAFARRRVIAPKLVDAGALVSGFSRLLAPLIGPNVSLVVRAEPGLRSVRVDPTQFEQVVMNLAVNARDAMPGGGRLVIETANAEHEGRHGVRLTVRDSGVGMTADVQARIFEPFFTTKPLGEGTGLGLPTVHGIVHQAGGTIDVSSAPGTGTTFTIFFPAADPAESPSPARARPTPVGSPQPAPRTP